MPKKFQFYFVCIFKYSVYIFIKYFIPLFTLIYLQNIIKYILKYLFRSTLFERNILQLYFTAEKSYDVMSYPNLGMIYFQTLKPFIRTWDSKTTFHKKCYRFQQL